MRHEKISLKWKVYQYLLCFTAILLVLLWMFQTVYLDAFYTAIKKNELEQALHVLEEHLNDEDLETTVNSISEDYEIYILLAKEDGTKLYDSEYMHTFAVNSLTKEKIQEYFNKCQKAGKMITINHKAPDNMEEILKNSPENPSPSMSENSGESNTTNSKSNTINSEIYTSNSEIDTTNSKIDTTNSESDTTNSETDDTNSETNTTEGNAPDVPSDAPTINSQDKSQDFGNKPIFNFRNQDNYQNVTYADIATINKEDCIVMVNAQLTPVDATVHTIQVQLIYISIIMIVLSLLIALLVSKKISRSIVKVNKTAKELANGKFEVEFNGKDYREIAELSDTLNYTAKELGRAESLQRELIANVSHDLRTPLTMIIAYSEVMRDLPGENTPENVQVVIDESRRLTNLVNDMLDISKLQAGVMESNIREYDLTESIKSVITRYAKLIEQDGYGISFEYTESVHVEADEFKIYQVIYNLINNAINYTGEDKQVYVKQKVVEDRVRIEVTDTGIGIAEQDIRSVWNRYYKVDKTHKRAIMGTGLGLSIVKNMLELHCAKYGVESEVNLGSTFWFELKCVNEVSKED